MFTNTKEVNECLLKIKQGDKSQYEPLFNITAKSLNGVAQLYLYNKNLADDVVSETFIKIINYIDSFDNDKNGYNWLCKITQNIALTYNVDESRTAHSEKQFAKKTAQETDVDFNEMDFFEQISELSIRDKEIAIARFYLGLTYNDIGNRFNISKVAAYYRVKKICKTIAKKHKNKQAN